MSKRCLRTFAALLPVLAACGPANDPSSVSSALRNGTLHDFCRGEAIPVWTGGGNASSAKQIGTLVFGQGNATLTLFEGEFSLAPTALHLQFADARSGIPVNDSGNPVPGLFACQIEITPVSGQTVYPFDLSGCSIVDTNGDGTVFAAAHFGIAHPGGVGSVGDFYLPSSPVSLAVIRGDIQASAYFSSMVVSGAGALDGSYSGWCTDPNRGLPSGPTTLYSTYDSAAMAQVAALVDPPTTLFVDRFPIANYIVNHYFAGITPITPMDATCNPITIPGWDTRPGNMWTIQLALWKLMTGQVIEDDPYAAGIVCEATANGAAFVPACGQLLLIYALPIDAQGVILGQSTLIQVPVPCGAASETAWADGLDGALFPGARQWGAYFEYDLSCGP